MSIQIVSTAFADSQPIPAKYTCEGQNISPPLRWSTLPLSTKSHAIIVDDPDAPSGVWVHWVIYNLPSSIAELFEGIPKLQLLPAGVMQGLNSWPRLGYDGPCPPPGKPHRYFFKIYALDTMLNLKAGVTKNDVLREMRSHILDEGQLMGTYQRK